MEVVTQSFHSLFPFTYALKRATPMGQVFMCFHVQHKDVMKNTYGTKLTKLKYKQARSPHTISYNLWVKEDLGKQSSH